MIVPFIELPEEFSRELLASFTQTLRAFGLLGRVAIGIDAVHDREVLKSWVKEHGGQYEIQILMSNFDEELGIALLNAGAHQLILSDGLPSTTIPLERIQSFVHFAKWKDETPTLPETQELIDNWKAGLDHLIDIRNLESPQTIADVLIQLMTSDRPDGLWPTVIVDSLGIALGLAYSNANSIRQAFREQIGVYYSRSRDEIWVKGKTSGAEQKLLNVRVDCDFDTIRFMVDQASPGFCHKNTHSCFGNERSISEITQRLSNRIEGSDSKSFTKKLFDDSVMLQQKLLEEAQELSDASTTANAAWEAADLLYFSLIAMAKQGATLPMVYSELARRMQRVVRRKNKLEPQDEPSN